jgi:4,5-dihydroxyphthalate decarboxylase
MLSLSLAMGDYDRTAAIFDGRVRAEGCELQTFVIDPAEAFHRAFKFQEFDVTELSLSTHTFVTGRGDSAYVGIPAFLLRTFRHSAIFIRTDRGITTPQDLRGKTLGIGEYQQTAQVWARGMLQHEYGVAPHEIKWRTGGFSQPGRKERTAITIPPEVDCKPLPEDRTLPEMLDEGVVDGLISTKVPPSVLQGKPHVARLFPDYPAVEAAYFQKTRIFPIMHLVGVRRTLVERYPWLPVSIFKAFLDAKATVREQHLTVFDPWVAARYDQNRALLGDDFWSYDVEPNRHVLEALIAYSYEQGLVQRKIAVEDLFAPSVMELAKT